MLLRYQRHFQRRNGGNQRKRGLVSETVGGTFGFVTGLINGHENEDEAEKQEELGYNAQELSSR